MLRSIFDDIKREFSYGNMITRIIIVNVAVFLAINLLKITLFIANAGHLSNTYFQLVHFFSASTNWWHNLTHPWVLVTSTFLHEDFFHILWNMLFLMWFGRIVGDFIGNQRVLPIYLLGGIAGLLGYFGSYFIMPYGVIGLYAMGASAAVMAFVVAAAKLSPDYPINIILIGEVRLKYIALVFVLLDLIGITNGSNTGGHFAHICGAVFGWIYIVQLRSGNDWAIPINRFLNFVSNLFTKKEAKYIRNNPKMTVRHRPENAQTTRPAEPARAQHQQERLDEILDKIKESGYDQLSAEDKEFLFQISKK